MTRCPSCGTRSRQHHRDCPNCGVGRPLTDGGVPDEEEAVADDGSEGDGGVSRREMLGYGGGSALATLGVAGGLWVGLVYEDIGPAEQVVRDYFNAINRNNFNTAERLFHEESPDDPAANDRIRDLLRVEVSVDDTEVRERYQNASHEAVQEYALVVASVVIDNGSQDETFDIGVLVAKNTVGEWRIWRDEPAEE